MFPSVKEFCTLNKRERRLSVKKENMQQHETNEPCPKAHIYNMYIYILMSSIVLVKTMCKQLETLPNCPIKIAQTKSKLVEC